MSDQPTNPIREAIADAIASNEVILFMKGNPSAPACGFSMRTVQALQALDARFAAVDVLPDPRIRQELSALSQWPTIPQLFVRGELVGGCDIVVEMSETGELAEAARRRGRRVAARAGAGRGRDAADREPAVLTGVPPAAGRTGACTVRPDAAGCDRHRLDALHGRVS